jgi:hypothetical protein
LNWEQKAMSVKTTRWATRALRQQLEIFGDEKVSLDSLWRAVGSPAGHDPRHWTDLAAPLLGGFSAYLDRLSGDPDATADMTRLLWTWQDESKDPWHTGDLMSNQFIAAIYAGYLDEQTS